MTKKDNNKDSIAKFLYDYLPLVVFFVCYKFVKTADPLITATIWMIITTFIALIVAYFLTGKIAKVALFSGLLLGFFGGLTIFLKDDIFIKMKPTVINLVFAAILFYGFFTKKPFLSYLLGGQIKLGHHAWLVLSWRWAWFFVALSVLNEIIWRNFSTDCWVQFKVFGIITISMIFTISQVPYMIKEIKKEQQK